MRPDCLGFHVPLWLFLTTPSFTKTCLAVLHAQRPVSAVAEDKSSQPEQQDLPGPPPLRKLHFHMFTLMVCGFLIIGAQRLAYRQSQSDASPGDPLAYVFKARQLQQSEGIRAAVWILGKRRLQHPFEPGGMEETSPPLSTSRPRERMHSRGSKRSRRSSLRQLGNLVFGESRGGLWSGRNSQASAGSSQLTTAGSLILRESSTGDLQETEKAHCIMARYYKVPPHILKRGFSRLEMRFSPDSAGEIRASLILTTLSIFDQYFRTGRTKAERKYIVESLETSISDFTKKKWNADVLFNAFCVRPMSDAAQFSDADSIGV
eukprot:g13199.t1